METIGSLVERLQGLMSRSFLIASFIPSVVFIFVNSAMVYWVCWEVRPQIETLAGFSGTNPVVFWLAIVLFLFVFALVLWSLSAVFRQFLEGNYLPGFIADRMAGAQYRNFKKLVTKGEELLADLVWYHETNKPDPTEAELKANPDLNGKNKFYKTFLSDARTEGKMIPSDKSGKEIDKKLKLAYERLNRKQMQWKQIRAEEMKSFLDALAKELSTKNANNSPDLNALQIKALKLFEDAFGKIQSIETKLYLEEKSRFPTNLARLGPTQMANFTAVHREYGLKRYGLEIEYFWLRLLKIIKADTDFYPVLEEAKTQLDFSVISTTLLFFTTFIWIIVTFFATANPWPYCVVAAAGIPLTSLFYNTAVQNYKTFIEAVRSAIDLHRFELLKALHIELPPDADEETAIWKKLYKWPDIEPGDNPVQYQHEGAPEKAKPQQEGETTFLKKIQNWLGIK